MQSREKLLAGVVGCLLALLVVYWIFGKVHKSFADRWNQVAALEGEIREKVTREERGKQAALQLAHWEHRSLPSDVGLAKSLYKNHLVGLADKNKLENVNIDAGKGGMHRNIYFKLPFTVNCKGSLEQMVSFLYDFYSTNHLHQLRDLTIKPAATGRSLDLNFTIEALVLPGADRKDALNEESGDRLSSTTLAAYRDPIVKRNLFAEYFPPQPPKPQVADDTTTKPPAFDAAKFTFLTAIVEVGEKPQAWITIRTTNELLMLGEGDKLNVGDFHGTITKIDASGVELESNGKRSVLALGKNLRQATEAGSDAANHADPQSE